MPGATGRVEGLLLGVLLVLLTPCIDYLIVFTGLVGGARARLLAAAAAVQAFAHSHTAMAGAMVPLMMVTLAVVVGSQIAAVSSQISTLARVVPLYAAFVVIAVGVEKLAGRITRLDMPSTRAVMFSAATRNSLVVLPLALALPAPLAVVQAGRARKSWDRARADFVTERRVHCFSSVEFGMRVAFGVCGPGVQVVDRFGLFSPVQDECEGPSDEAEVALLPS